MQLIRRVEIRGFRSLQDQSLDNLGSLTALVGKNSSGKSNVLRALNLFFNGEVEPGKPLNFARDHYDQVPPLKKKRLIQITVEFLIPAWFKFRKEFGNLRAIGPSFSISRTWQLDQRRKVDDKVNTLIAGQAVDDGPEIARQFLSLVFFRFIPNRSIPSELLKHESQAIADSIFMRMKGDKHAAALLTSLTAAAARMLRPASDSLVSAGAPLAQPQVTTAESLGQMLRMTGFQATGPHGGSVQDEDWGSGHQAFFLYSILHSLDTTYSRFFGWRQATIWGVEEPESALHRDLETRFADRLRKWSFDETSRLQIVHTTHSPIMTMASDAGFWVEVSSRESTLSRSEIPGLTRAAESKGVAGWVHPLLAFPWNPIVLVEGHIDVEVLSHVAALAGLGEFRFLSLPQLDPSEKGAGKDSIVSYLKRNKGLAQNRPREAPLVVLFDWEVPEIELKNARTAYGEGGDVRVRRMDETHCNQLLGPSFKGIERFYPPAIVRSAHEAGELILGIASGKPYSIAADQLVAAKGKLLGRLRGVSSLDDLDPLVKVLLDCDRVVRGSSGLQMTLA